MKKVAILVSTVLLFAGMTFGQTPQTQEKLKPTAVKSETPAVKKDAKGCEKTCTHKGKAKSGCCAKKTTECKKDAKTTTTPEKK